MYVLACVRARFPHRYSALVYLTASIGSRHSCIGCADAPRRVSSFNLKASPPHNTLLQYKTCALHPHRTGWTHSASSQLLMAPSGHQLRKEGRLKHFRSHRRSLAPRYTRS